MLRSRWCWIEWRIYKLIELVTAFVLAWLASIVNLEFDVFFLVCAVCFTIRNLFVFTTNRNAYLQAIKEIIDKRRMHAKAVGRDKRRMEGFSPTTISPQMQAELSRRMLEDIEQDLERMFTQDTVQAGHTANGHTRCGVIGRFSVTEIGK